MKNMIYKIQILLLIPVLILAQSSISLFDGVSLKGWKPLGDGSWTVSNGEIVAKQSGANPHFTHLVQDTVVKDFRLGLLFRSVRGNAGFFFRQVYIPSVPDSLTGVQVVIEPQKEDDNAFALYETNGREWLTRWGWGDHRNQYPDINNCFMKMDFQKPTQQKTLPDSICQKPLVDKSGWNRLSVWAKGPRIVVKINMRTILDYTDAKLDRSGHFAFKLHAGEDVEIHFKDIELSPLIDSPTSSKTKLQKILLYKGTANGDSPFSKYLKEIANENGIVMDEGVESDFNPKKLADYQVVVLLGNGKFNFNVTEKIDFENWIKNDHGVLCFRGCLDSTVLPNGPWLFSLANSQIMDSTDFKERNLNVDLDAIKGSLWKNLNSKPVLWRDSWYRWKVNPRGQAGVTTLLSFTDDGNNSDLIPKSTPYAWLKTDQGGRIIFSGMMNTMNAQAIPMMYDFFLTSFRTAAGDNNVSSISIPKKQEKLIQKEAGLSSSNFTQKIFKKNSSQFVEVNGKEIFLDQKTK